MSTLSAILGLVLAAAALMSPARSTMPPDATDLEIVGSAFGRVVNKTVIDPMGPPLRDRFGRPRPRPRGLPPPTILLQREAYVLVRNVGTRTIESVDFSFVFYADATREVAVARRVFQSKQEIRPGEMKFLSVNVKEAAPTSFDTVSLDRIGFDDGTSATP